MSNDRQESEGSPEDERRSHRERDKDVKNPWSDGYDRLGSVLKSLGVDIHKEESVEEWNADREWVRERRKRGERWRSVRGQLTLIAAGSILTGAVGWVISWLNSHFGPGAGHP